MIIALSSINEFLTKVLYGMSYFMENFNLVAEIHRKEILIASTMSGGRANHLLGVGRGFRKVIDATLRQQQRECQHNWKNSSIKSTAEQLLGRGEGCLADCLNQSKAQVLASLL